MTQSEHTFIAGIVSVILYQIVFHTYLKHRPATQKNIKELAEIFKEYF